MHLWLILCGIDSSVLVLHSEGTNSGFPCNIKHFMNVIALTLILSSFTNGLHKSDKYALILHVLFITYKSDESATGFSHLLSLKVILLALIFHLSLFFYPVVKGHARR